MVLRYVTRSTLKNLIECDQQPPLNIPAVARKYPRMMKWSLPRLLLTTPPKGFLPISGKAC